MYTKFLPFALFLLFNSSLSFSQSITGIVLNSAGEPIVDTQIKLTNSEYETYTNREGKFSFDNLVKGDYEIIAAELGNQNIGRAVILGKERIDIGSIKVSEPFYGDKPTSDEEDDDDAFDLIVLNDNELFSADSEIAVAGLLNANLGVIGEAVAFTFNAARFRRRGFENENVTGAVNGIVWNSLNDGRSYWPMGGLNDVARNQNGALDMGLEETLFSHIGGFGDVNIRAGSQRPQTRLSYAKSNRSYRDRLMVTHSSGTNQNGWAYSLSYSRRWGQAGYIEGTFYDAHSYFASVEKEMGNHSLNLAVFGTPSERGRSAASTPEAYELAGTNFYNPNWGYQNGEVRNARSTKTHQPVAILNHDWTVNDKLIINSAIAFQTGEYGISGLDWFLASDPRPDYYRNLPNFVENEELREQLVNFYKENPEELQLDWQGMYDFNRNRNVTIPNANNSGEDLTGGLSGYVIQNQRFDVERLTLNTNLQYALNDRINIYGGASYRSETNETFKELLDLLGGEFYVDYDEFAIRDLPLNPDAQQADLNNPNRILGEGDIFGNHYDVNINEATAWTQLGYAGRHFDFFAGAKLSNTQFWREGYFRNGLFPESSEGESEKQSFLNYQVKAGATYKLNNRNYLSANINYMTRAPFARFAYISPRTRDQLVPNLTSEKILSGEASYVARFPKTKATVTGYYTRFDDGLFSRSFYHDQERGFVNYIMNGVSKVHQGIELGIERELPAGFKLEAVALIGDYYYADRPVATISQDNNADLLFTDRTVYLKNYKVTGSPQKAFTVGLDYNSPKFWFATINLNYFDDIYINTNPDRRTEAGVEGVDRDENPELWNQIIAQEKVDGQFTLDIFGGKSFKFGDYFVNLTLGVSNILNNTDFITNGFEQLRFDYETKDVNRFQNRYYYSFGTNYFVQASLRY